MTGLCSVCDRMTNEWGVVSRMRIGGPHVMDNIARNAIFYES
jgi:hypothetical protein